MKTSLLKKSILLFFLMSNCLLYRAIAQKDTIWYDKNWKLIGKENASFFRPPAIKKDSLYLIKDYYIDGTLQMEGLSRSNDEESIWEGEVTWYTETGKISQIVSYKDGFFDGDMITYYKDQKLVANYKNGKLISGKNNFVFSGIQQYTEIKDSIIREVTYNKDLKGIRYESIKKITDTYPKEIEVKYYGNSGEYLGALSTDDKGKYKGISVIYYQNPLRVKQIRDYAYKNGIVTAFYYPNGVVREQVDVKKKNNIEYFDRNGKFLHAVKFESSNKSWDLKDGTKVKFYSNDIEDKVHLIEYIEKLDANGKIIFKQYFYENQKPKSKIYHENNIKKEIINYDESGKETSRLQYKGYQPYEGIFKQKNRELVYKEGVIIKETEFYPQSNNKFSVFENGIITYFDKKDNLIGEVISSSKDFLNPEKGTGFSIDYKGRIISKVQYVNNKATYEKKFKYFDKDSSKVGIEERYHDGYYLVKQIYYYHNVQKKRSVLSYRNGNKDKVIFYDRKGNETGRYDYNLKSGTLLTYFYDTDIIRKYKEEDNGTIVRSKKYDKKHNPNAFNNYEYVLIEDIDVNNKATYYTENGDIVAELLFKNKKPFSGTAYDHKTLKYYAFANGEKNGLYKRLQNNGMILEKGNYVNDVKEGAFVSFDYSGNKIKVSNYKNDMLEGTSTYYDRNGKAISSLTYSKDIPVEGKEIKGDEEIFYKNGNISKIIKTNNDGITETSYNTEKSQNVVIYDSQRKLKKYEYTLLNYRLNGKVIKYNKEGKIMYTSIFEKGVMKSGEILIKENSYKLDAFEKIWIKMNNGTLQMKCFRSDNEIMLELTEKANEYGIYKNTFNLGLNIDYIVPNMFF
ncbi:toxin-antitoxin system YwqK family antitoxin [Aquimarina litoralis]|uniref:toxin-antitoxin system YwqK family antitoxin n=1 Tax=Aquimarina litoralis TaxID=584605 RepID=UPI001C5A51E3|nr:hypothetical protein [Aquimarina litoralis]MBW1296895.1 hypothetical protein [Aquimarina litoralis]